MGRKRAEEQYEATRASGRVNYPDLMAAAERYKRTKPPKQEWLHLVRWLRDDGWTDGALRPSVAADATKPPAAKPEVWIEKGTPQWRAHVDAARLEGFAGLPERDHPKDRRRRGWFRESEWPPGVDPADYGVHPRGGP